jgi:hypothetical protein
VRPNGFGVTQYWVQSKKPAKEPPTLRTEPSPCNAMRSRPESIFRRLEMER